MHLLVIGATGPSGIAFVDAALEAGHELTIYARSPKKLSWEVLNNAKVHSIEGTFEDKEGIRKAVTSGATAVVSCAGPVFGNFSNGTPVAAFYERLYDAILSDPDCKITRCLILSTPSFPAERDGRSLRWMVGVGIIYTAVNFMYKEIIASSSTTSAQPVDKLGWTLFRVPVLTNGAAGPVNAGFKGDGKDGLTLSRKSLARWLVTELGEAKWIGQAPMLSNA